MGGFSASAPQERPEAVEQAAETIRALGRWTGTRDLSRGAKVWVGERPMFLVIAGLEDSRVTPEEPTSRWQRCFSAVIEIMNAAPELLTERDHLRKEVAERAAEASRLQDEIAKLSAAALLGSAKCAEMDALADALEEYRLDHDSEPRPEVEDEGCSCQRCVKARAALREAGRL